MKQSKLLIICIVVTIFMSMTSCTSGEIESKFNFSEIESGLFSAFSIVNDISKNCVYILGAERVNSSETSIVTMNADTLVYTEFEHALVFDESQKVQAFFPNNNGYWVFAEDPNPRSDSLSLNYFSSAFELVSTLDIRDYVEKTPNPWDSNAEEYYNYHIWGSTIDGRIVISHAEMDIFTLNFEGERQTWDLAENSKNSKTRFYRAVIYDNDIYYFSTSDMSHPNSKESTGVYKLLPNGSIEELFFVDFQSQNCFIGEDGRIYLSNLEDELYVLDENGDAEFLFNWSEIKKSSYLASLVVLDQDKYLVLINGSVYLVSKDLEDKNNSDFETDTRKVLILACYGEDGTMRQKIHDFNRKNEEYQIKTFDYSQFEDGMTKLNLDILTGNAPDMIYWSMSFLNPLQSAAYSKSGQLVDLYTLLDRDPEINRDTFLSNLLKATESKNGSLYELPLAFQLYVTAGSVDVVGTEPGWTPDEFFALLNRYPSASNPFGTSDWQTLLMLMIYNNSDTFMDWENGLSHFDSAEFIRLLEIAKIHYEGANTLSLKDIQEGRQLFYRNFISDVSSIQEFTAMFDGPVNVIGLPTSQGIGNAFVLNLSVSIFVQSEHIDTCWNFLKELATYEEQIDRSFPANYMALEERLNNPTKYEEAGVGFSYRDNVGNTWSVIFQDATPEESEQVRRIIESCDRVHRENRAVMAIIAEEASAFIYGDKTAEEVARIIQNKAQTYVSEQK